MPHFSFMELVIIMVVILLLFGAKRIPEVAGSLGKGIKEFKKEMSDIERNVGARDAGPPPRLTSDELQRPYVQQDPEAEQREPRRLL